MYVYICIRIYICIYEYINKAMFLLILSKEKLFVVLKTFIYEHFE